MLLIIDNYDSFTYNLYQGFASLYSEIVVIRNDKITMKEIKDLQPCGVILSPGPGRPEEAGICVSLIQAMLTGVCPPIPVLGVCLGHQAITVACGGRVIQAGQIVHGKDDLIYHQKGELYQKLPQPFKAGRYHSLVVEQKSLPTCLEIEAENRMGLVMGIRHRSLPIYGLQFHPESILTPEGKQLMQAFVSLCMQRSLVAEISA